MTKQEGKGKFLDFGIYINADDIAQTLISGAFHFDSFQISTTLQDFTAIALASGLVGKDFSEFDFLRSFQFNDNSIILSDKMEQASCERLAQIIADFLRKTLLAERKKISFETVFSHPSKVEFMKQAVEAGYKVYLYFVSTESPDINVYRVKEVRVKQGKHDVDEELIRKRYSRSMDLLFEAAQLAYQCYFFDNSGDSGKHTLFAHFKQIGDNKQWDKIDDISTVPSWFRKYYVLKVGSSHSI